MLFQRGIQMVGRVAVSGDKLINNVVQVTADDLRLRTDSQNIVARTFDQCSFPAGRHGTKRVPCVAGDQAKLRGADSKLLLDVGICVTRGLMVFDAIRAEASFEKVDNAAMLQLTGLNLKQIVRESEQPETCIAQLAKRCRNLTCGGIVENFSLSSSLSAPSILMPCVSAIIFITAAPISVNGT